MAKEILLYDDIYSWSSSRAVSELNDAKSSSEIVIRFNGDGGELRYGWAVIGKAKELKGKKTFKNDGEANSMYAFAFCYNNDNEALDTSFFKMHRASYSMDYERSEYFSDADKAELLEKNNKLRAAMEAKMNIQAFTRITGYTLDQFFSMDDRVECILNAEEAFECNLVNKIIPITPGYSEQVRALTAHIAPYRIAAKIDPPTPNKMADINSKEALKAAYPELYKQIFAAGVKRGIAKENERVTPMFAYMDTNGPKIIEAFKSGKTMDEALKMECMQKSIMAQSVRDLQDEGEQPIVIKAEEIKPAATAKTVKSEVEKKAFEASMDQEFKKMYPNSKKVA